jgi:hypothetical protein
MMALTPRESALALITGFLLLLVVSGMLLRPRIAYWGELRDTRQAVQTDIAMQKRIVDMREPWLKEYRELSRNIPLYAADQKMDVFLRSLVDKIASDHGVVIRRRDIGAETKRGEDLYERTIPVQWAGTLEALVAFLRGLQEETKVIMDIRDLRIEPPNRRKHPPISGRFNLVCIYSRTENQE